LVTREDIIQRLWGDDVFVDTRHGINTAVHKLRTVLRDDAEKPRILETVFGKGYRLVSPLVIANPLAVHPQSRDDSESSDNAGGDDRLPSSLPPPTVIGVRPTTPELRRSAARTVGAYTKLISIFAITSAVAFGSIFALNIGGIRDRLKTSGRPRSSLSIKMRRSVAVVGFKNLSGRGDAAWLSTALADMLTTELAAGGQLRIVSGENIARAKSDLLLSDTDSYAADTLLRLRR